MSGSGSTPLLPPLEPVARFFKLPTLDSVRAECARAKGWLVAKDTELPGRAPAPDPLEGRERGDPVPLNPGDGVERRGSALRALRCGYVHLEGRTLSVVSPIWVSKDGLAACFLNLRRLPNSTVPKRAELRVALADAKVRHGVSESALEELSESLLDRSVKGLLVTLAKGTPPVQPKAPKPTLQFTHEAQAGKLLDDGSIDFKERDLFSFVQEADLLAQRLAPRPGVPGKSVWGEPISVDDPIDFQLVAGDNVRLEEKDGARLLFAEVDGEATVESKNGGRYISVTVRQVARIQSDIDYETGNLDFKGSLIIHGTIHSGFRVTATGDIAISGTVEDGVQIDAGGKLSVGLGIVGPTTRIRVGGDLAAKFIQEASVEVGGNAVIGGYIFGALVICKGHLRVEARGGSGRGIVGGEVWALRGMHARTVGSRLRSTRLVVGTSPELASLHAETQRLVREAGIVLGGLLDALGIPTLDPDGVRELIKDDPSMRKMILFYAAKALKTKRARDEHALRLRQITERLTRNAARAPLEVAGQVYAPIKIQIGIRECEFEEDLERVRFTLTPCGGRLGVVWRSLGEGRKGAA